MSTIPWRAAFTVALLAAVTAMLGTLVVVPKPPTVLDWDGWVLPLARDFAGLVGDDTSTRTPLQGKMIVITGATNGIGYSLTKALSKLGATVVAIGRSEQKLQALQAEIPSVMVYQADLGDLASVAHVADEIQQNLDHVDVLVNNAGIHGGAASTPSGSPGTSLDMDHVFVTNYLGHFLLTDRLLGLLKRSQRPKVVQMSSTYHWGVDGTDLVSGNGDDMPIAARPGGSHGFYVFQSQRSYANSKLAQIYHARMLQRLHPDLHAVSVCPAWVGTGIAGPANSTAFWAIHQIGYPVEEWGIASSLYAILDSKTDASSAQHNDYYSNSRVFEYFRGLEHLPSWSYRVGLRDVLAASMAHIAMFGQHFFSAAYTTKSSPESYDVGIAQSLYDWSTKAIA